MSFVYLPRKQEDIDLHRKLTKDKRVLTKEYQDKRSDYDKDLESYNKLIRKLDGYDEGSLEHKNCLTDIDVYLAKLQPKPHVVIDIPDDTDDKPTVKPKVKRVPKKKEEVKE
jgi:hypothetical protein